MTDTSSVSESEEGQAKGKGTLGAPKGRAPERHPGVEAGRSESGSGPADHSCVALAESFNALGREDWRKRPLRVPETLHQDRRRYIR